MIVFIASFVIYAIVNSWIGYVDSKERRKRIEDISYEYIQQQERFKKIYDSTAIETLKMAFHMIEMEKELRKIREQDEQFNKMQEDRFKELEKKYRNEKDYIPDVSDDERYSYMSEYEYEVF